ncbi:MAG: DUF3971 domain-containing protein [Candidatus Riflebacteria bacterium]|nr:DUF3971 domain-containing protein [Candidatus Riflebacteria bacterium]
MEENAVKTVKKSRGVMFYLKVLLVFMLLLGASLAIGLYYVYHRLTTDSQLEKIVGEKISTATGMDVNFSGIEVSFPNITIRNIRVATDSAELKLDANIALLSVTPDFFAALQGELVLDSIDVASGITRVEFLAAKSGAEPAQASAAKKPLDLATLKLPFRNVGMSDLRFSVKTATAEKPYEMMLKSAGISRSMLSSTLPFNIDIDVISVAAAQVEGRILWPDNISASLKVAAANVEELKKLVPADYQKHLAFVKSASTKADVEYNLKDGSIKVSGGQVVVEPGIKADVGVQVASVSPLKANATFKLSPLQIDMLWPMVKDFVPSEHGLLLKNGSVSAEGSVVLNADAAPTIDVKVVPEKITISAKALPEAVQLERGQIRYNEDKISFSGFSAKISDSQIQLVSGSLKIEPLAFSGEVSADANFDSIWKMVSGYLSEDAKRVTPSGKASFKGNIAYDSKGPKIDGTFASDRITLKEKQTSAQATVEKVKVRLEGLGDAKGKIHVESLEAKGVGALVRLKGVMTNAADIGLDFSADGNVNIDEFAKIGASLFKLPIKPEQFKGELILAMQVGGKLSDIKPKGRLELKNVHADLSERGFVLAKLNGAASADLDKLVLDKVAAEILGGKVSINGTLQNFKKPVFDASLGITGADLGQIRAMVARNYPEMPKELELSGKSDLNVNLKGSLEKPDINGDASLKGVRFFHPAVFRPVENITGPIKISNKGLTTSGVSAGWGTSKANITGELTDWGKLISNFKFVVSPLDATDAAGFFLKDTGYVFDGKGTGSGAITGPLEKIKVAGVASIPAGLVTAQVAEKGEAFKFPFQKLTTSFSYTESVFSITSAEFNIFSGKVTGSGKVFLASEPIKFEFNSNIDNLLTQEFLKQNTKYPNMLTGALNGSFNGRGNTLGLNELNGDAKLAMPKGTYNSPPFIKQIADKLNAPQLASGTIDNAAGDYKISAGRISSNNVLAKAGEDRVTFVGSVGLDTTLDGEARFLLNRQTALKSNILKELIGDEASVEIPVTVKGSFMSPSVGIPLDRMLKDAAERRAKSAVKKEAGKVLDRLFGGKKQPAAQTATATAPVAGTASATVQPAPKPSPQKQIENKIKDLGKDLKNIFRR